MTRGKASVEFSPTLPLSGRLRLAVMGRELPRAVRTSATRVTKVGGTTTVLFSSYMTWLRSTTLPLPASSMVMSKAVPSSFQRPE